MLVNPYLFICVFIKMQPENTGNMYTIFKTQHFQNKIASKGKYGLALQQLQHYNKSNGV